VRGSGPSIDRNPSPELLRNSTSPDGRGGTEFAAPFELKSTEAIVARMERSAILEQSSNEKESPRISLRPSRLQVPYSAAVTVLAGTFAPAP
jgi:hypothetical protein